MKTTSERTVYFIGFLMIALLFGVTFYLQKYDGFTPCPLCILQRIAFGILGVIFFLAAACNCKKTGMVIFGLLATFTSLLGILLAGRQVWLQHLPADKSPDCGVSLQYLIKVLPFDQAMSKILHGTAECSKTTWQFLHFTMAEWSLLFFIFFIVLSLFQIMRRR